MPWPEKKIGSRLGNRFKPDGSSPHHGRRRKVNKEHGKEKKEVESSGKWRVSQGSEGSDTSEKSLKGQVR